jgi:(1->4)-alpha-D-glucan 1-alpha-D-glucosylmutase
MNENVLDQLAELCGIEPSYQDIWGITHKVSEKTKLGLLRAMGLSVDDEASVRSALAEKKAIFCRRLLDPVLVVRENESPIRIKVRLAEKDTGKGFEWSLKEEGGNYHSNTFLPKELKVESRGEVGDGTHVQYVLSLPVTPGPGYHQLEIRQLEGGPDLAGVMRLIVAPAACYTPYGLKEGRVWGPGVQLYALRSRRNWGIGDLTDLKTLVSCCADMGAGILGINPLHALFLEDPGYASPYSPSSRLFINPLYLDVEAIADFPECEEARDMVRNPEFQARLASLREGELVDYNEVAAAKRPVLEILYRYFRTHHLEHGDERCMAFRSFQDQRGEELYHYGLFEALQEHFHKETPGIRGWAAWQETYRNPKSSEVAEFSSTYQERVEFFQYLQWQADLQLGAVGRQSMELGLKAGLYEDLAVGVDPAGAETWVHKDLYALGVRIGAPPDDFNLNGQDWGLPPLIPDRLIEAAYAPFVATLRANMRYAGALRIDHVMGLMRLFCLPRGSEPAEGAYVRYPFKDLLGILALESQRNRCLVIGEDLGTVSDEVRRALKSVSVLSCKLFYFEKEADGKFKVNHDYPEQALVAVSTHDLPTLSGYWRGWDISTRTDLGLFPEDSLREAQIVGRAQDRARLLIALERQDMLPNGMGVDPASVREMTTELVNAIHLYLARTPSKILMFQLEDIFGQLEQVNLPGTIEQYPNWRRKIALDLEVLMEDPRIESLARILRRERGGARAWPAVSPEKGGKTAGDRIPLATYRLQFNRDFTFAQAADIVPYLRQLGISHCYSSPYLKARPGSPHGYDIIDHSELNPEIGSWEDFIHFVETLYHNGMGQILDLVPNHMGIGCDNDWWIDVLENGPASPYADFFDIDWWPVKEELRGKVLLPILEDHYGSVLENGLLRLTFDNKKGEFGISYHDHIFPVDPATYAFVLGHGPERLEARLGTEAQCFLEFQSLVAAFENLPTSLEKEMLEARLRDKEVHKRRLARLCIEYPEIDSFIRENVILFNGTEGDAASFYLLHRLLEAQSYRLAHWRVASDEINYRRFFDINDLAGLKTENPRVFEATHSFVLDLIGQGKVDGLRIDHPDGLYDPAEYYRRLNDEVRGQILGETKGENNPVSRKSLGASVPIYLVAEKILASHERLREDWQVHGTTGYDFANLVGGLFVNTQTEKEMGRIYTEFVGNRINFEELLYQCKKLIMRVALASELNVLAGELSRISESDRHTRDFTLNGLRDALSEVVACFPVYRTYVTRERITPEDRRYVDWAIAQALKRSRAADTNIYDFIKKVLLLDMAEGKSQEYRNAVVDFAMKFQQYTGPVMAKGLEDTAFYTYNLLISLNEVGGEPRRFGASVSAFHHLNQERAASWPHSMLNTSTHDSKRSEDVRTRISVLSEIPADWGRAVTRWSLLNSSSKPILDQETALLENDEYALYQTLVGAWPTGQLDDKGLADFRRRIEQYMIKAAREAKVHSSWINPNLEYEDALIKFVQGLMSDKEDNQFLKEFLPFQERVAWFGMFNSLSQTLLKLTVPGVPDIYQGNEVWSFRLVDPDNRSPVDFGRTREILRDLAAFLSVPDEVLAGRVRDLMGEMGDGRIKLYLTWKTLSLRWEHPELFQYGTYLPLTAYGTKAEHVCAFARRFKDRTAVVAVPRLCVELCGFDSGAKPVGSGVWFDTRIDAPFEQFDEKVYRNIFTGECVVPEMHNGKSSFSAASLFSNFPVALLTDNRA